MYIDPFWAGVLSVIFIELVLLFVACFALGGRKKK